MPFAHGVGRNYRLPPATLLLRFAFETVVELKFAQVCTFKITYKNPIDSLNSKLYI